jgi:transposase-like protein
MLCCRPNCQNERTSTSYCKECFTKYRRELRNRQKADKTRQDMIEMIKEQDISIQKVADKYGIPRTVNYR